MEEARKRDIYLLREPDGVADPRPYTDEPLYGFRTTGAAPGSGPGGGQMPTLKMTVDCPLHSQEYLTSNALNVIYSKGGGGGVGHGMGDTLLYDTGYQKDTRTCDLVDDVSNTLGGRDCPLHGFTQCTHTCTQTPCSRM